MKDKIKLPFEPYILAYSNSYVGNKIMTVLVPIPTVKLAELRTHRVISQSEGEIIETAVNDQMLSINANSSRAIPIKSQIDSVSKTPYYPVWTEHKAGMQGDVMNDKNDISSNNAIWDLSLYDNLRRANDLADNNTHKQDASLLLNPYSWTTAVITADEFGWRNFFELRCPKYTHQGIEFYSEKTMLDEIGLLASEVENTSMTYPALQVIAEKLYDLWCYSEPVYLEEGQWHIPFFDYRCNSENILGLLMVSMSKCAMISYDNQDKDEPIERHIKRAIEKLIPNKHISTAEHQYQVPTKEELLSGNNFSEYYDLDGFGDMIYVRGKYVSNIKGWKQLRKLIECGEIK